MSIIVIGGSERGIALQRAKDLNIPAMLASWLDQILAVYGDRILPFDLELIGRRINRGVVQPHSIGCFRLALEA